MRKIFFIFSVSILLFSACATTYVNLGDDREYYSRSEDVCEKIDFTCAEGTESFSDKSGCGCEDIDVEEAVNEEVGDKNETEEVTDEDIEDTSEPDEEILEDEAVDEPGEEILGDETADEPDEEVDEPEEEGGSEGPMIIDGILLEPLDTIDIGDVVPDDTIDIQPIPIPIPDPLPQF